LLGKGSVERVEETLDESLDIFVEKPYPNKRKYDQFKGKYVIEGIF